MPRKSIVRRQGDTMAGELYLNDHPGELAGSGKPNGNEDMQAATKFYVDNTAYSSSTNLFVATSGDDLMTSVPQGREGTGWMWRILERMSKGESSKGEVDMLMDVTKQIEGHTICAFGEGSAWPVQGLLRNFKKEIEKRNNFNQLIKPMNNTPYLVDQHLLDKENV